MQVAMLLASTAAYANEPQETITIRAQRDPVDKSYRKMVKGMDLFEEMHSTAPNASLRYKLLPRQRDTNMDGIVLKIVGDSFEIPVPVASDHTFTLERHQKALDENASVRPNRKAHSMTWRTEIRTPGLPPNTRRLGDLRLECHVGMEAELISNALPVIGLVTNLIQKVLDFCNASDVPYLFFSERPLFSVTMIAGARRAILSVDELYAGVSYGRTSKADLAYCDCQVLLDRTYYMPLGDRSWPDDTLIEFEYMDDENDRQGAVAPSVEADVIAALGKSTVISFDSGFEVRLYQVAGDKRTLGKAEFVVLFAPSGVVKKTRIRPASPPGEAEEKRL
jgi:hypothetical protein